MIKEARVKVIEIRTLSQFQYIDETGKDHGLSLDFFLVFCFCSYC